MHTVVEIVFCTSDCIKLLAKFKETKNIELGSYFDCCFGIND